MSCSANSLRDVRAFFPDKMFLNLIPYFESSTRYLRRLPWWPFSFCNFSILIGVVSVIYWSVSPLGRNTQAALALSLLCTPANHVFTEYSDASLREPSHFCMLKKSRRNRKVKEKEREKLTFYLHCILSVLTLDHFSSLVLSAFLQLQVIWMIKSEEKLFEYTQRTFYSVVLQKRFCSGPRGICPLKSHLNMH